MDSYELSFEKHETTYPGHLVVYTFSIMLIMTWKLQFNDSMDNIFFGGE